MGFKLGISVNISVHNLNNDLFANQVKQILVHRGLESSRLTLEITETGVMENAGRAIDMLRQLSKTGIVLAIDDYGTGFSSLAYLKQLPVHMLKIDKSFVMHMDRNQSDATIVQSTIDLGHNLGLRVVAEGVENESVHQMLAVMGCDCSQGYLLSRPLSPADFASWLGTQEVELARHG
jgi:EAL domain-containing protein (putative c-di-GMP-specific phosphodiesterase class I)